MVFKILPLIGINLVAVGMCAFLVLEQPQRWPLLATAGPLLFIFNLLGLRAIRRGLNPNSAALSTMFGAGLIYAMYRTVNSNSRDNWIGIAVGISLFTYFVKRHFSSRGTKHGSQ